MQSNQYRDRFQIIVAKLLMNKSNEFTVISKNKLYMKVHMYPYILEKKSHMMRQNIQ